MIAGSILVVDANITSEIIEQVCQYYNQSLARGGKTNYTNVVYIKYSIRERTE